MEVLDESPASINRTGVVYGGFWVRLGATFIDILVLAPFTALTYFNIVSWKSMEILILLTLLPVIYKPFCEFYYGATVGKMALRLKVVNLQLERANIEEILLRNIFYVVPTLISLVFSVVMFNDPEFLDVDGFIEYSTYSQKFTSMNLISYISGSITIVDGIMLIADTQNRALHDRIGKTFVVLK